MTSDDISDTPTNLVLPKTDATLTIRIIKSFQYRTERSLVLQHVNLEQTTVGQLKDQVRQAIQIQSGFKPYRTAVLDTLKLYTKAHGAKTTNLIINMDHEEWIYDEDSRILADLGLENESELSFFNRKLYDEFKQNPNTKWES